MNGYILKSIWAAQSGFNGLKKLKTQIGVYREVGDRSERTWGKEVTIIKIQHMKVSKN